MDTYRSYFKKNNTLLYKLPHNTARNEVFEMVYGQNIDGTKILTRYLFQIDLENLSNKVQEDDLREENVVSHKLRFYNCINLREDQILEKFPDTITERATDFELILFEIPEEWSEGTGYFYAYEDRVLNSVRNEKPSNWFVRKSPNIFWTEEGVFSGSPIVIASQRFELGNENIDLDITDYVNEVLFSGRTHHGLGIAFSEAFEDLDTEGKRLGVTFHSKYTTTFYEPFLETKYNRTITDDRNTFYLDKNNKLYLYTYVGGQLKNLDDKPLSVSILDDNDELYITYEQEDITHVAKGVYEIDAFLPSSENKDQVIYKDVWSGLFYEGVDIGNVEQEFVLISQKNYYKNGIENQDNVAEKLILNNNLAINWTGIKQKEKITRGDVRRLLITLRQNRTQDYTLPVDFAKYRMFVKQGTREIEIIPYTSVNNIPNYFYIDVDTSWLLPNYYYIQLQFKINGVIISNKELLQFRIVNEFI